MTVTTTSNVAPPVQVTVRYFAAARAAAGAEVETLSVEAGTSVGVLVDRLSARGLELALVLRRCSFLCDGMAVRDPAMELTPDQTIDVLPPFAGG